MRAQFLLWLCIDLRVHGDAEPGALHVHVVGEVYVTNMVGLNAGSDSIKLGWGTTSRRMYNMRWENIDVVNYCPEGCGTPPARVQAGRIIGFDLYITHRLNPSVVSNVCVCSLPHPSPIAAPEFRLVLDSKRSPQVILALSSLFAASAGPLRTSTTSSS